MESVSVAATFVNKTFFFKRLTFAKQSMCKNAKKCMLQLSQDLDACSIMVDYGDNRCEPLISASRNWHTLNSN